MVANEKDRLRRLFSIGHLTVGGGKTSGNERLSGSTYDGSAFWNEVASVARERVGLMGMAACWISQLNAATHSVLGALR